MPKKAKLMRGSVKVSVIETEEDYYGRNDITPETYVEIRFKTDTCRDSVFVDTSEISFMPEEIDNQVKEFNEFADAVAQARETLNARYLRQKFLAKSE